MLLDQEPKFRRADKVYYRATPSSTREGPFLIGSVEPPKKYSLCYAEDGQVEGKARGDRVEGKPKLVDEENLELA